MKILFKAQAFQKLRAYVGACELEVSGFGKVTKTLDTLVIEDIKIFPQVVTAGSTVMEPQALAKFWDELMVAGEDIGQWKLWWHSHVYMQASFSATDFATIEEFDSELPEENWMLSIVTNKQGTAFAQIDVFAPIRCTIPNVPWDVDVTESFEVIDVTAEVQEKVVAQVGEKKRAIAWRGSRSQSTLPEQLRKRLLEQFPHSSLLRDAIEGEITS